MHKKLLSMILLSVLLASTPVGCGDPAAPVMLAIEGEDVSVKKAGAGSWVGAQAGMSLEPGDIIKTGGGSNAVITFQDGSTVELEAGTEIEVESLGITGAGSTTIVLKHKIGSITFRVTKVVDTASRYEVETPTGVAAVRGSIMRVDVIEDGTTRVTNLAGDIWAIAQGEELQIPEGQRCIISPGQPPRLEEWVQYDLKIASTSGGSVTTPGEGVFTRDAGSVVSLMAPPAKGYRFVNWTGDVGTVDDVNAASTTITMNGNYSIIANFEEVVHYDLKIASTSGGSVTVPGEGVFTYGEGTVVSLTALPTRGYRFVNWTGDVGTVDDVNAASTTITMNGNYSIIANFEGVVQYDVKIAGTSGGSVTVPGEGVFTYEEGTVVSLTALPTKGYRFVNWTGDVGTIDDVNAASTTITMNGNYSITANFEIQYELKIASTSGGSVTTPGEGVFTRDAGSVVSLMALPVKGYRFVNWTGDVGTVGSVNSASTTITMNGNYSITANFEEEGT